MIKIRRGTDNQFYFVVVGKNGQVLVTSEMYTRKEKAIQSATALIDLILGNEDIEIGDFTQDLRIVNGLERTKKVEDAGPGA